MTFKAAGGEELRLQQNRLYNDLAHWWPVISPPEEYLDEARYWRQALREKLGSGRHEILELGVGGGHLLSHLTSDFQATAVDISEKMLSLSQQLNPGVEHHLGDMRTIRLGQTFRAVLVHDAVNYLLSEKDLRATFATACAHLEPGGVFILAPDWFRDTFPGTSVQHWIRRQDGLELTFIEYLHDPDPTDTTVESLFFLIFHSFGNTRVEQDRHLTGLFPLDTWLKLLGDAGFQVELLSFPAYDGGYGGRLLVGVLRQNNSHSDGKEF
jgi:SAM-dependent methyltransferase